MNFKDYDKFHHQDRKKVVKKRDIEKLDPRLRPNSIPKQIDLRKKKLDVTKTTYQ